MVPLTDSQVAALVAIREAWPDADLLLIGALALGHHIPMAHRVTNDLDLAVAISLDRFPGALLDLPDWKRDPKMEHRFFSPTGQMVDVLPAGQAQLEAGYVEWPSGIRMNLVGFDLAFAHATTYLVEQVGVLVPDAPVLMLLKMVAWLDRPSERTKDLGDLAHLLVHYIEEDADRRFSEEVFDLELDFDEVSPWLLGDDLGRLLPPAHRGHVERFLERAPPEQLTAYGPASWNTVERAERGLAAFERGFRAASAAKPNEDEDHG